MWDLLFCSESLKVQNESVQNASKLDPLETAFYLVTNSAKTLGGLHALAVRWWPEALVVEFGIPAKGHITQHWESVTRPCSVP